MYRTRTTFTSERSTRKVQSNSKTKNHSTLHQSLATKIAAVVTLIAALTFIDTAPIVIGVHALSLSSSSSSYRHNFKMITSTTTRKINKLLITIPESKWRSDAHRHTQRIETLLRPGLTSIDDQINSGIRRSLRQKRKQMEKSVAAIGSTVTASGSGSGSGFQQYQHQHQWTALDGKNPIYNFLIEYYGLKGAKGPRRLGRWSPDPKLLLVDDYGYDYGGDFSIITPKDEIQIKDDEEIVTEEIISSIMEITKGQGGIFLQNAQEEDLGDILHLRGAIPIPIPIPSTPSEQSKSMHGILYNPSLFYNRYDPIHETTEGRKQLLKTIAPFQWYKSILETTLNSEPIFHCHGLHEWAMLYQPDGAAPPPSGKYQKHLPLRVSRETINSAVERRGISCTHVDALRFFAPEAGPLNHHGSSLLRTDQLRLEQKGCVHAHMDLLKIALKLQPFLDPDLLCDVLEVSIAARKLDVEASPYDVTGYGGEVVPVETEEGRRLYRSRQRLLMERAEPIRRRLLKEYEVFMHLSFDDEFLGGGRDVINNSKGDEQKDQPESNNYEYAAPERFATAQPGGLPWRKNLIDKTEAGF